MKVAYLVSMFPCWSETFLLREIGGLGRHGLDVTIVSLKRFSEDFVHPEARDLVRQGRVIYPSAGRGLLRFLVAALWRPLATARLVFDFSRAFHGSRVSVLRSLACLPLAADCIPEFKRRGIQHIHAPWGTYPSTAALYCHVTWGYPFSFTVRAHDLFVEDHGLSLKFRKARFAQTISEFNRRFVARRYPEADPERLHVIHSAINPGNFGARRTPVDPPLILSVGRLAEIKGFPDLIEACAILNQEERRFRCTIVGEGPLRAELLRSIEAKGLEGQVELVGSMPQDGIVRLLEQASCFALPCVTTASGDQDGIPNVLMEALASEVPVVSCPTSGVGELVEHEVTGLLAPPRDPRALAQAIGRILDDGELRNRLRAAGRQKVEREFNIAETTARLAALIRQTGITEARATAAASEN